METLPARKYREGAKVAATCYARFKPSATGERAKLRAGPQALR